LGLPSGLFPSGFPTKTLHAPLLSPIRAMCILLDLLTRITFGDHYRLLSSSLCSFLCSPCYLVPLRPKYSQHRFLEHPQLMFLPQCEWPTLTPIQTTGKIIFLYIIIFMYLHSKLEDKRFCTEQQEAFPDLNLLLIF
jgi:hypothetical protein